MKFKLELDQVSDRTIAEVRAGGARSGTAPEIVEQRIADVRTQRTAVAIRLFWEKVFPGVLVGRIRISVSVSGAVTTHVCSSTYPHDEVSFPAEPIDDYPSGKLRAQLALVLA